MKLIELEIDNLRGIPHLILKLNEDNFLVFGPNGSGKSAIVDATDFLLTGKISRMTGKGTKDIKLKEHGPHINSKPEDVFRRSNVEQWAVNANVHYNEWADFDLKDFEPVVEAFQDLFRVFQCEKCEGMIHVSLKGNNAEAVRCNCGGVNWNLVSKK